MIEVQEAKKIILSLQTLGKKETCPLHTAYNRILAEDVLSPIDLPVFDSSAMDGFAILSTDTTQATETNLITLRITEEIWAGKGTSDNILSGACARIMTGAMIPQGCDAVVMKEHVLESNGSISIKNSVQLSNNIRRRGEELKKSDLSLKRDQRLTPAAVGFLASMGITECCTYESPKVHIITTGTELVKPGQTLESGEIYESNSQALVAALSEMNLPCTVTGPVRDDKKLIFEAVQKALASASHVILCGGVSVGDYDYNKDVLADLQVKSHFWKVNQKPGKPFYFGTKDKALVFGVPGNPASSLVCFYNYIRPALMKQLGFPESQQELKTITVQLTHDLSKHGTRTEFLRARLTRENNKLFVTTKGHQGSHTMQSFAECHGLAVLDTNQNSLSAGDEISVKVLPEYSYSFSNS